MSNAPSTIKDIARRLGLHHSTVSRALNCSRQIPRGPVPLSSGWRMN